MTEVSKAHGDCGWKGVACGSSVHGVPKNLFKRVFLVLFFVLETPNLFFIEIIVPKKYYYDDKIFGLKSKKYKKTFA